jgi:hypothetical protein
VDVIRQHTRARRAAGQAGNVIARRYGASVEYTREEVLAQIHDAKEQGDPIGPYVLGDDAAIIEGFLAEYDIAIDADGGVVDLLEERDDA